MPTERQDMTRRVLVAFGTRPEAIKMAPVVAELARRDGFEPIVAVTAQHREMLDQVLEIFEITPDYDLDIMQAGQTLTDITVRSLSGLTPLMERVRPDAVLVQGDTTTTFAAALTAFYHKVPVGHVEAGLRTGDVYSPYPEEVNRRLTTRLTRWHFPPTATSAAHLMGEGVPDTDITITGNTVVDALLHVREMPYQFEQGGAISEAMIRGDRIVLVTAHRRESWGEPMANIFRAVKRIAETFDDVHVFVATHMNPIVSETAYRILGDQPRVDLLAPLDYVPFVKLMDASTLILSDSGGIQEEAPTLGKPALVLREVTERPEAIEAGVVELVGTDTELIVARATLLLTDREAYHAMAQPANPFGDGTASRQIVDVLERELG
jgi:UDP-N-acetylglucosamine 2-epimerase (non-hydrolysing)